MKKNTLYTFVAVALLGVKYFKIALSKVSFIIPANPAINKGME
jgi:hypothetical protein